MSGGRGGRLPRAARVYTSPPVHLAERWLSGRKHRLAKPAYGATCTAGSNPALSANPIRGPTEAAMDSVERFAREAAAFEKWLHSGSDREADAARQCLIRLLDLYRAGLELPPAWSARLEGREDVERVDDAEWRKAYEASGRLPLDHYSEVFDPIVDPTEAPVIGSVADDVADIYRDIATGLRAYERGDRAGAVWEWNFGLHSHWGAHATGAIRALHWWLCKNAPDRLPSGGPG